MGYRVLVVEDDPSMRDLIAVWLPPEHEASFAEDGPTATTLLSSAEPFRLLITDFNMPGMDGLDLLRWCRARGLHFPVILMSASRIRCPREEIAVCDCCAEILGKPLSKAILLAALERAQARAHDRDCRNQPCGDRLDSSHPPRTH